MAEGRIFISYRRGLDNGEARALYYQLERFFDRDRLFMDVDDIPVGVDFVEYLDSQVAQCQALIAVIGRGWVSHIDRLHEEEDFVRIELDAALKRGAQIPIIPLLIDGSTLPVKKDLPEDLHPLRRRNGVPIRHDSYPSTIEARLIPALSLALKEEVIPERQPAQPGFAEPPAIQRPEPPETAPSEPELPEPGSTFRDGDPAWAPEMVVIPTGSYMMGSTAEEAKAFGLAAVAAAQEQPRHKVDITQPFALARHATTFGEYDAFCQATEREKPKDEGWGRGRRPVINVTWNDATAYCDWLSERTGYAYRLPSEAEWEYACRAGTETGFSFGDVISSDLANYNPSYTAGASKEGVYRKKTVPVDFPGFQANAFGLSQMHGNVWERCADQWAESYESARSQTPFSDAGAGSLRVLRGGSWLNVPQLLRSARRDWNEPDARLNSIGFRPARTLLTP
ncbi:MAG: SUMF1/EgtB/PvdO family nonheme iron enzyme [Pseudomonadota bacterium]